MLYTWWAVPSPWGSLLCTVDGRMYALSYWGYGGWIPGHHLDLGCPETDNTSWRSRIMVVVTLGSPYPPVRGV